SVVFRPNKFTARDRAQMADTLGALVLGTPLYVAGLTYSRAFLVLKRSDWLFGISIVQLIAKITLNIWLIPAFGIAGIGISTSLTYALSSGLLIGIFHLRLGSWQSTLKRRA